MSELNPSNYRRVARINFLMSIPLFGLFAWIGFALPYAIYPHALSALIASMIMAFPLMLTMLHGHVTIALGVIHRDLYYQWLARKGNTMGWFFHPIFTKTTFRLSCILFYSLWVVITGIAAIFGL